MEQDFNLQRKMATANTFPAKMTLVYTRALLSIEKISFLESSQYRNTSRLICAGHTYCKITRSSQSIKIGIDLSIDNSIKIGKSDLIDIDCIDQSVEIDDTLVSFIDLSRFYRFHRFISEDTSVLLFIQKLKLISGKQLSC